MDDATEAGVAESLVASGVIEHAGVNFPGKDKVKFSHALEAEYAKGLGRARVKLVKALMASKEFAALDKGGQDKALRRHMTELSDAYKVQFFKKHIRGKVKQ
jgi:hypothetical protein